MMTMGNAGFSGILLQFKIYGRKIKKNVAFGDLPFVAPFKSWPFSLQHLDSTDDTEVVIENPTFELIRLLSNLGTQSFSQQKTYNGRICVSKEVLVKPPPLGYDFVVE